MTVGTHFRQIAKKCRKIPIKLWEVFQFFCKHLLYYFKMVANASGITSIRLIFEAKLHTAERIFWSVIVISSFSASYILIMNQIKRFQTNPTVMSLDRDYRAWNGILPGLTLCYLDHMDSYKADIFIEETWNVTIIDEEYFNYLEFLYAVANATAYDYGMLIKYADDERFDTIDLYEVVKSIDRHFEQKLTTFNDNIKVQVRKVITERGMCYAINSPMSAMLDEEYQKIEEIGNPVFCQYGKHPCFIKMDISESTGRIEVHSPYEVSGVNSGVGTIEVAKMDEIAASFKVMETFASDHLRSISPDQRKCVFNDESTSGLSIYSKTLCLERCRAKMALEMCNCVPFFYPFVDGPKCNPAGFECLSDFKWPIWALHICNCPNTCNEQMYSVHSIKRNSWGLLDANYKITSTFRWDIIPPKVRMRRDVVFNFEDLLVSVGGAIGLFLGASFLTLLKIGIVSIEWFLTVAINIFNTTKSVLENIF